MPELRPNRIGLVKTVPLLSHRLGPLQGPHQPSHCHYHVPKYLSCSATTCKDETLAGYLGQDCPAQFR